MTLLINNDFHVHTYLSPCAKDKLNSQPLRIISRAETLGLNTIGFTDHFFQYPYQAPPAFGNNNWTIIERLRDDLSAIQTDVRVLVGCEADQVTLDTLSIDADLAQRLDFVIISASHFHLSTSQKPENLEPRTVAEHYMKYLRKSLEPNFASIIAHPFYTPGNTLGEPESYMAEIHEDELIEISELARDKRIAFEVNGHIDREPGYLLAVTRFFQISQKAGVKFTFGSDAHHMNDIGCSQLRLDAIKELGLKAENFLSADELLSRSWD